MPRANILDEKIRTKVKLKIIADTYMEIWKTTFASKTTNINLALSNLLIELFVACGIYFFHLNIQKTKEAVMIPDNLLVECN